MSFDTAFNIVVGEEGDYSNDPNDAGGETRYGITKDLARKYGYFGDMRQLPFETAREIYRQEFWDGLQLGAVDAIDSDISVEIFDTSVNTGGSHGILWMQRILNAFNKQATFYADIAADGRNGPATLGALTSFVSVRGREGITVFLKAYNCLQGEYYVTISEKLPRDEDYVYGWIRNRISL